MINNNPLNFYQNTPDWLCKQLKEERKRKERHPDHDHHQASDDGMPVFEKEDK